MANAAVDFEIHGRLLRGKQDDELRRAKQEYRGNLNFSAWKQAHDPCFLGTMGKNNYGKPWGNDSSKVESILAGPTYWKRICYKELDDPAPEESSGSALKGLSKSASAPGGTLRKTGYELIREKMKDMVEGDGKPRLKKRMPGERLDFFNSLVRKYDVKTGGSGNIAWNIDTLGHRSSPNEVKFIASCYFRNDADFLLEKSTKAV